MGSIGKITKYGLGQLIHEMRDKGSSVYDISKEIKSQRNIDLSPVAINNFLNKVEIIASKQIGKDNDLTKKVATDVVEKMVNSVTEISKQLDDLKPILDQVKTKIEIKLQTEDVPTDEIKTLNDTIRTILKALELYERISGTITKDSIVVNNSYNVQNLHIELNKILNQMIAEGKIKRVVPEEELKVEYANQS
jgi:seryl-tRNA synthetase